jgi:uncharacterized membrane protein
VGLGTHPVAARDRAADLSGRLGVVPYAIVALTVVLGLLHLRSKSVWIDEAISIQYARDGVGSLAHVVTASDPNMSFYYVLLSAWSRIVGDSALAARSLSVLAGAAAVLALYALGARLFGRWAGLAAALLLAVNAFFVSWTQQARGYSLLVLLVTLSSLFFVRELEEPSRANLIAYVAASVLAVYTHYFATFVLLAQLATLLGVRRRAALEKTWLLAGGAVLLLCAPELAFAVHGRADERIDWLVRPNLRGAKDVAFRLAGSRTLLAIFFCLACFALVLALVRRSFWREGFLATWCALPFAASFAISHWKPVFLDRYLIVCVPALALLVGGAIAKIPVRALGAVILVAVTVLSAQQIRDWYRHGWTEDWRQLTAAVFAQQRDGDGMLFEPAASTGAFGYYERHAGVTGPVDLNPHGSALGRPPSGRVWIVWREMTPAQRDADVRRAEQSLGARLVLLDSRDFEGPLTLALYRVG